MTEVEWKSSRGKHKISSLESLRFEQNQSSAKSNQSRKHKNQNQMHMNKRYEFIPNNQRQSYANTRD